MKRRNGCAALPPLLLLLLLALLLALCGCSGSRADYVGRQVGLDLPRTESVTYQDSHGGFHGDGLLLVELAFAPEDAPSVEDGILRRGDLWNEGPFDDYLGGILYEGGPAGEGGWPRGNDDCYWYFRDRQQDERPLNRRGSWNYTAALYDAQSGTLYYLEFDT